MNGEAARVGRPYHTPRSSRYAGGRSRFPDRNGRQNENTPRPRGVRPHCCCNLVYEQNFVTATGCVASLPSQKISFSLMPRDTR